MYRVPFFHWELVNNTLYRKPTSLSPITNEDGSFLHSEAEMSSYKNSIIMTRYKPEDLEFSYYSSHESLRTKCVQETLEGELHQDMCVQIKNKK